jgi:hypothetical protein
MLTYQNGVEMLARRHNRKLGNNTYLSRLDDATLAVRLHATDVVLIHADGTYTLNSGGWRTVTTKERLNNYSPARVSQKKNVWYVHHSTGTVAYQDGMKVNHDGAPASTLPPVKEVEGKMKKVDRLCRDYVKGFCADAVKNGALEKPSGGDCFGCSMRDDKGNTCMGCDHILSHLEEKYYVPSLLVNALQNAGNPHFMWQLIDSEVANGRTTLLHRCLTSYLRKLKPELVELV